MVNSSNIPGAMYLHAAFILMTKLLKKKKRKKEIHIYKDVSQNTHACEMMQGTEKTEVHTFSKHQYL